MSFKRLTFVVIYLACSSFGIEASWAAKSSLIEAPVVDVAGDKEDRESDLSAIARHQSVVELDNSAIGLWASANGQTETESQESSELAIEAPPVIRRNWPAKAMVLTFGIALFLIWTLFRQPPPAAEAVAEGSQQDKSNREAAEAKSNQSGSLGSEQEQPDIYKAFKSLDLTVDPVTTIAESIEDPQSVERDTAEIDVVQELIQDLQPNASIKSDDLGQKFLRRKAIWELTKVGDYRSIEPLMAILPQANDPDRGMILEAVKQITRRNFQPVDRQLFTDLQDRNPEVRLNALRNLKNLYQFVAPALSKIAQMQSDPDYEVRQTAIQALQQFSINPLPEFANPIENEVRDLVSGEESEANLHLVAYLLAELDAEKK